MQRKHLVVATVAVFGRVTSVEGTALYSEREVDEAEERARLLPKGEAEAYMGCMEGRTDDRAYNEVVAPPDIKDNRREYEAWYDACYGEKTSEKADEKPGIASIWFVRHGESEYNKAGWVVGNLKATAEMAGQVVSSISSGIRSMARSMTGSSGGGAGTGAGEEEVVTTKFVDAQLSKEGVEQALDLRTEMMRMCGTPEARMKNLHCPDLDNPNLLFATSNLRRAAMTLAVAFEPWLGIAPEQTPVHRISILSALQEKSRGPDAKSLAPLGGRPLLGNRCTAWDVGNLAAVFDPTCNMGNLNGVETTDRFEDFCHWLHSNAENRNLLVVGHSMWLQEFLKFMAPVDAWTRKRVPHPATQPFIDKKIDNAAMVKLSVLLNPSDDSCFIGISPQFVTHSRQFAKEGKKEDEPEDPGFEDD
jgi:hypothetical protein